MSTKTQLENDVKNAMRAGDDLRKRTLRMALSTIKLAEIEKGAPLEEPAVLAILQKEIKSRREVIAESEQAHRPELVSAAQAEIAVLEAYLPQSLTEAELEAMARQAIAEVGATSPQQMGQVMKVLVPRIQGRADAGQASQVVRKLLS